jgi:hypothetical protein
MIVRRFQTFNKKLLNIRPSHIGQDDEDYLEQVVPRQTDEGEQCVLFDNRNRCQKGQTDEYGCHGPKIVEPFEKSPTIKENCRP